MFKAGVRFDGKLFVKTKNNNWIELKLLIKN